MPIISRQITLLNIEVEQLRAKEDEAREIKEILFAYVERVEQLLTTGTSGNAKQNASWR